ncbi:MAG TPA: cyclic nucleotide-binding domain-containing protein [bacterium]|nr:cyclic nucleotide-binding domain-containing protein [bacterium]HOL46832.1 cyclic nucleotide-binding domain-containing protein [bacterium]HPQ18642.1 cyclic nucleotide-binding domain-containing protein [bacterium]
MAINQKKFKKGDIVCYQNENSDELFILLQGKLEVLVSDLNTTDKKELLENSFRVAIIDTPKSPFGEISFILKQPRTATIRALDDSVCAVFKGTLQELNNLIKSNPQIGISIALNVIKRYKECKEILLKANNLYKELQSLYDNFSFTYYKLVKGAKKPEQINKDHKNDKVYKYGKELDSEIINSGKTSPNQLSVALLETDLSNLFNQHYGFSSFSTKGNVDYELALFFEHLLSLPVNVLNVIIQTKPLVIYFMSQKLVQYIIVFNGRALEAEKYVEEQISMLVGPDGCFSKLYQLYLEFKNANVPNLTLFERIVNILLKNTREKLNMYVDIWGKPFTNFDKYYKQKFDELLITEEKIKEQKIEEQKIQIISSSQFDVTNQLEKIMSLTYVPAQIKEEFRSAYNEYLKIQDKFDTAGESKKIKKNLTEKYWNFTEHIYKNFLTTNSISPTELFVLRFGIVDDLLLNDNIINAFKLVPFDKESKKYPIYYADEWLQKIYNESEEPSINELGQTYKEYLKEQGITNESSSGSEYNWNFAKYEINNMLKSAVRTCTGSLATQIPILDKDFVVGNPEETLLNKERLEKAIDKILDKTFSLFYREVRVIYENQKTDYFKKEIAPNFIIVPIFGSRVLCWQELVGSNKASRGRILVPLIPTENIEEMLKWGLASFYWELNKTIAGPSWGDPIEGGVTGKYFDYTSTYKQNKDITDEAKEKINELFKKYTTTRDRFAAEYLLWINYESEGIAKLNKVSRDIFYNYVPFRKSIRDKLQATPLFESLGRKFDNLAKKEIMLLQNKIKKLENENIKVPQELIDATNFYNI